MHHGLHLRKPFSTCRYLDGTPSTVGEDIDGKSSPSTMDMIIRTPSPTVVSSNLLLVSPDIPAIRPLQIGRRNRTIG